MSKSILKGVFLSRYSILKRNIVISLLKHFKVEKVGDLKDVRYPHANRIYSVKIFSEEEEINFQLRQDKPPFNEVNPHFLIMFFPYADASKTFFESYVDKFLNRFPNSPVILFNIAANISELLEKLPYCRLRLDHRRVLCTNYVCSNPDNLVSESAGEIKDPLFFNHVDSIFNYVKSYVNNYGSFINMKGKAILKGRIPSLKKPSLMANKSRPLIPINEETTNAIRSTLEELKEWSNQLDIVFGKEDTAMKNEVEKNLATLSQSFDDLFFELPDAIGSLLHAYQEKWEKYKKRLTLKRYLRMKVYIDFSYVDSVGPTLSPFFPKVLEFVEFYGPLYGLTELFLVQASVEELQKFKDLFISKQEMYLFDKSSSRPINIHILTSLIKEYLMNYPLQPFIQNFGSLRTIKLRTTSSSRYSDGIEEIRSLLFEKLTYHQYLILRHFLPFLCRLSKNPNVKSSLENLSAHFCTIFLFRPETFQMTVGDEEQFRMFFNQMMADGRRVMMYLISHAEKILGNFSLLQFENLRIRYQRERKEELEIERINWKTAKFYMLHKYWEMVVRRRELKLRSVLFDRLSGSMDRMCRSMNVMSSDSKVRSKDRIDKMKKKDEKFVEKNVEVFQEEAEKLGEDVFFETMSEFFDDSLGFWKHNGRKIQEFMEMFDAFKEKVMCEEGIDQIEDLSGKLEDVLKIHRRSCMLSKVEFEKESEETISEYREIYRMFVEKSIFMKKFKFSILFMEDDELLSEKLREEKMGEFERMKEEVEKCKLKMQKIEIDFKKRYYLCYHSDLTKYFQRLRREVDEKIRVDLPKALSNELMEKYPQIVCPLTFKKSGVKKIMQDPVVLVDSGITYERSVIYVYIQKNQLDPITKRVILTKKIVPNLVLKQFIQQLSMYE